MSKLIARIISHTSDAFWDQVFNAAYFLKHFGEVCWKTNPREVRGPDSLLMQWIFVGGEVATFGCVKLYLQWSGKSSIGFTHLAAYVKLNILHCQFDIQTCNIF